jgi:putative MFS transporter
VQKAAPEGVKALFGGIYKSRTFMLWGLWLTVYSVNNGMITWFPTLYKTWFNLSSIPAWPTAGSPLPAASSLR